MNLDFCLSNENPMIHHNLLSEWLLFRCSNIAIFRYISCVCVFFLLLLAQFHHTKRYGESGCWLGDWPAFWFVGSFDRSFSFASLIVCVTGCREVKADKLKSIIMT